MLPRGVLGIAQISHFLPNLSMAAPYGPNQPIPPAQLGIDEDFGTDTYIHVGADPTNPSGSTTFPERKQGVDALGKKAARGFGFADPGRTGPAHLPKEQAQALLCEVAAKLSSPQQSLFPHIPSSQLDGFRGVKPANNQLAETLDALEYQLVYGIISEGQFAAGLSKVGEAIGANLSSDLDKSLEEFRDEAEKQTSVGEARWTTPFDESSEAKVYRSPAGFIFKVMELVPTDDTKVSLALPIVTPSSRYALENFIDPFPLLGEEPSLLSKTALNNAPGFVQTEWVGVTEDGQALFKQLDVGDNEPNLKEIRDAILGYGHKVLAPLYPKKTGDIRDFDAVPALVEVGGIEYIVSDLREANARKLDDGRVVFIDFITRKRSPDDQIEVIT